MIFSDCECEETRVVGDWLRAFVFQQDDVQKPHLDLSLPEQYGLSKSRLAIKSSSSSQCSVSRSEHFFIENPCGKIGAWFLQPEEAQGADNNNVSRKQQ